MFSAFTSKPLVGDVIAHPETKVEMVVEEAYDYQNKHPFPATWRVFARQLTKNGKYDNSLQTYVLHFSIDGEPDIFGSFTKIEKVGKMNRVFK